MALLAICPACEETLQVKGAPKIGQQIVCRFCETPLEVISTQPLELDWVDEDEDWDDDDDDEEWEDDDEGY